MISISDLVEIKLKEEDDFLKVRETLTRIGVASKKDRVLYQSCHILHKKGLYYLVHFKELFALDGKETDLSENDLARIVERVISESYEEVDLSYKNPQTGEQGIIKVAKNKFTNIDSGFKSFGFTSTKG